MPQAYEALCCDIPSLDGLVIASVLPFSAVDTRRSKSRESCGTLITNAGAISRPPPWENI